MTLQAIKAELSEVGGVPSAVLDRPQLGAADLKELGERIKAIGPDVAVALFGRDGDAVPFLIVCQGKAIESGLKAGDLARGLAKRPKILLLDEPLGALDRKLRERTQFELVNLQERIGITFIMVTHDQEEAMTMSDRIAIMDKGRIHQIGAPRDVYEDPTSRFIADFIGAANLMAGRIESVTEGVARVRLIAADTVVKVPSDLPLAEGDAVTVMVRPERITAWRDADSATPGNTLTGVVSDIAYLGDLSIYHVQVSDGLVVQVAMANRHRADHAPLTWDDAVTLSWYPGDGLVLTA